SGEFLGGLRQSWIRLFALHAAVESAGDDHRAKPTLQVFHPFVCVAVSPGVRCHASSFQHASVPRSMGMNEPLIPEASSLARNAIVFATSSGSTNRFTGWRSTIDSMTS